ncbi:MAG: tetratricopeptide repeat protein, partial [Cyclobacteriaceae bacterium]|nr:tetratricopeptide repeat protein [Cyclobacteriaceae bacterium]
MDALWARLQRSDTTGRGSDYMALLKHYYGNSPDTVEMLANQLLAFSKDVGSKRYELTSLCLLADTYYDGGKYAKSISTYLTALQIQNIDGKRLASIHNDLGRGYRRLGDKPKALEHFFKSVDLARQANDVGMEGTVYNNLAIVFSSEGNDSLSLDYHLKAMRLSKQVNDSTGVALAYNNIGETYLTMDRLNDAKESFKEALTINETLKDTRGLAISYSNMGSLALEEKDFNTAIDYLTKAHTAYEEIHVSVYVAETKLLLSEAYLGLGRTTEAIRFALDAMQMGNKIQSPELTQQAAMQLSTLYKQQGNHKQSLQYLEISSEARDKVRHLEIKEALDNYTSRHALEKKQLEVSTLEADLKMKEVQEQRQRLVNYALTFGTIAIFIVTAILWYAFRQKQKINKLLLESQRTVEFQNSELRQLSAVKDKLFSITAHDFKGPLASINGLLPLLRDNRLNETERTFVLDKLSSQLNATTYFLDNLLQWSRSQFSNLTPKPVRIELTSLITECMQLVGTMAASKKITITNHASDAEIYADVEMMRLVLRNLVSNAIKFSREGTQVLIQSTIENSFCHISIVDQGVGIPADKIDQLFKLETIVTSGTRNELGTGLGLTLCKDFVTANGGQIWVKSKVGEGTTFTFSVPL